MQGLKSLYFSIKILFGGLQSKNYSFLQVVTYFFYKNLTFTLTQFWFTFQTGFSGQRFYDDWFQSLYNVIFTALPVIIVGLFDQVYRSSLFYKHYFNFVIEP